MQISYIGYWWLVVSLLLLVACTKPSAPISESTSLTGAVQITDNGGAKLGPRAHIVGAWSTPVSLSNEVVENDNSSFLHGPALSMGENGGAVTQWRMHRQLDSNTGSFLSNQITVMAQTTSPAAWMGVNPIPAEVMNDISYPQIIIGKTMVYALWANERLELYLSHAEMETQRWSDPIFIGLGQGEKLYLDRDDNASIVWIRKINPSDPTDLQGRHFSPITGLSLLYTLETSQPVIMTNTQEYVFNAVRTVNDQLLIVWAALMDSLFTLSSVTLDDTGLKDNREVLEVAFDLTQNSSVKSATELVLAYDNVTESVALTFSNASLSTGQVFATSLVNGNWSTLLSMDEGAFQSGKTQLNEFVEMAASANGTIVMAWSETDDDEQIVRAKQYRPNLGWGAAVDVSDKLQTGPIIGPGDIIGDPLPGKLEQVDVAVDANGNTVVAWVKRMTDGLSQLYVSQFDSINNQWHGQALVETYQQLNEEIKSPQIAMDNDQHISMVWQQAIATMIGKEFKVWASEFVGGGNVVPTPTLMPTPTPNPGNGGQTDPEPNITWSAPVSVWQETVFSNQAQIHELASLSINRITPESSYIDLHRYMNFDSRTSRFFNSEHQIFNTQAGQLVPMPFTAPTNSAFPSLYMQEGAPFVYAIWIDQNSDELFLSYTGVVQLDAWSDPVPVSPNQSATMYEGFIQDNGSVIIFWESISSNGSIEFHASEFIPQATSLASVQVDRALKVQHGNGYAGLSAASRLDSAGNLVVAWIEQQFFDAPPCRPEGCPGVPPPPLPPYDGTSPPQSAKLNLVRYVPGVGWEQINDQTLDNTTPFLLFSNDQVKLATAPNETMLVFVKGLPMFAGNGPVVMAIDFNPQRSWGAWENVDYNLGTLNSYLIDGPTVVVNNGHVMVIWSERAMDDRGTSGNIQLYSNHYQTTLVDTTGTHWPLPLRVSSLSNPMDSDGAGLWLKTDPHIAITADGRATAVWLESSTTTMKLMSNTYDPDMGWHSSADMVTSYDFMSQGLMTNLSMVIDMSDAGLIQLIWYQETEQEFTNQQSVWFSESRLLESVTP